MKTVEFISYLQALDVKLFLQEGELKVNAPQGVMTPQIIAQLKAEKLAIIDFLAALETPNNAVEITIGKRPEQHQAPMSFAQQRLWLLQQIDSGSTAYNGLSAYQLKGEFNVEACRNAWQQIINRHEVLRTNFIERDGQLIQLIADPSEFELTQVQTSEAQLPDLLNTMANRVFDLQNDALITVDILSVSEHDQTMVVNMHHIISDGWSVGIIIDEFTKLYDGFVNNKAVELAPVAVQYADFSHWQRENVTEQTLQKQMTHWQNNLKDLPALIELASDFARPAQKTYRGDTFEFTLDAKRYEKVKQLAENSASSVFMVMLSAFNILLSGHSSKQDIVVGTPTANRVSVDVEKTIGMFMNTLVLRNQLDNEQSFRTHLDSVRDNTFEAFEHQDLPFEQLVDALNPQRNLSFSPLFQVMFILQNMPSSTVALTGLTMTERKRRDYTSKYDLSLEVTEQPNSCHCVFEYSTDLFEAATIGMLRDHWLQIIDFACATPNASLATLSMLSNSEVAQIAKWNDTALEYDRNTPIHQLIDLQSASEGDKVACAFEDQTLSYAQLTAKTNQLAHYLIESGVNKGDLIGVAINRSNEMLVAVLAILKAGAAYVPMDPSYPADRIAHMADDSKAKFIISESEVAPSLFDGRDNILLLDKINTTVYATTAPAVQLNSNDLAYVIYTSGSTGKPKGVMIEHANVVNFLHAMRQEFDLSSGTWLALTSLSFDISVLELLCTLASGMKVVIAYDQKATSAKVLQHEDKAIDFSLYYFGNSGQSTNKNQYNLLLEGAKFGDKHNFHAIWTPERHFGEFGGLYPNPVITSAAIASITDNIQIRAGSIVLPLHNVIRVAEDWSVVDNISNGRIGMALASGWQPDDFALSPDDYANRHNVMWEKLEQVKTLWRGESIDMPGGLGQNVTVKTLPRPIREEIPYWITAAGNPETFRKAGAAGVNVLTHLLGQSPEQMAEKVGIYRDAFKAAGHEGEGYVTLMLHTFVNDDEDFVLQQAKDPFKAYLKSAFSLLRPLAETVGLDFDTLTPDDIEVLLEHGFKRYYKTSGLFGTPESCLAMVDSLKGMGINEIGCLLDFGINGDVVLENLPFLNELRINSLPKQSNREKAEYGIAELIAKHQVTHFQCTPSLASILMADDKNSAQLDKVKHIYLGGEPLSIQLVEQMREFTGATITNMYGPTETTIWSAVHKLQAGDKSVPIGHPIANTQIYTVDNVLRQTPIGVPGEIVISGDGVVRGYLDQPQLTDEKFIQLPTVNGNDSNQRAYKTGDLGCWNAKGELEILGRLDSQVKVNGFRIELGEIESVIRAVDSVLDTVVIVNDDDETAQRIVGYVVMKPQHQYDEQVLLKSLKTVLPTFMMPSVLMALDSIPLTPNGKVNRAELPAPGAAIALSDEYVAPINDTQQQLTDIWQAVLGREKVGITDNFFALGGNSVRATITVSRARQAMDIDVPVRQLFENPTVEQFALVVQGVMQGVLNNDTKSNMMIEPIDHTKGVVLSYPQQRLWFMDQLDPLNALYNTPAALKIRGALDIAALEYAFATIVERHESLRTCFVVDAAGEPMQLIQQNYSFNIAVTDLSTLSETVQSVQLASLASIEAELPFDIRCDLMLRAQILKLDDNEHVLLMTMHHIAADGWSMSILINEFCALYAAHIEGQSNPLTPLAIQYADYAHWNRHWLQGEVLEAQLGYWTKQLADLPVVHGLPLDKPRPKLQSFTGDVFECEINHTNHVALSQLCQTHGATLFMGLHAALSVLLSRYSNETDIVIGSPIANREQAQVGQLIGFFTNTLVLRSDLSKSPTFNDLLRQSKGTALDAYAHQQVPFEQIVEKLQPQRSMAHSPLFQVMLDLRNLETGTFELPGITLSQIDDQSVVAKYDLSLKVTESDDGLLLGWEYNTDLFRADTISRMAGQFDVLLNSLLKTPQQSVFGVNMLPAAQVEQQMSLWNDLTINAEQNQCIHQLFEAQVANNPDAVAVVFEGQQLNYGELNAKANQLACYLIENRHITPGSMVGICVERSLEMIICIVAVLKAGGAYVPLDPQYPKARLQHMLSDANLETVLTQSHLLQNGPVNDAQAVCLDDADLNEQLSCYATQNVSLPQTGLTANDLAYVIYTSGSTGQPKGVMIEHGQLSFHISSCHETYNLEASDRVLQFATINFDAAQEQIFAALTCGASLYVRPEKLWDTKGFYQYCSDNNLNVIDIPPSYCLELLYNKALSHRYFGELNFKALILGGEQLNTEIVKLWRALPSQCRLFNAYGPTETVITSCCYEFDKDGSDERILIGRANAGRTAYVLNQQSLSPIGVTGELHIGGAGLARGYLNQPEQTAQSFIDNPFDDVAHSKLYKTGDLVRWMADGNLEFVGRVDHQVKIRGYRIELDEITRQLVGCESVTDAQVLVKTSKDDQQLVAYVATEQAGEFEIQDEQTAQLRRDYIASLQQELKQTLPEYMVPNVFVLLAHLPLTNNGKVDTKALPDPDMSQHQAQYVAPTSELETALCDIWQQVLGLEKVGITDNFFELGGHSLLATRMIGQINQQLDLDLTLKTLFSYQTIELLTPKLLNNETVRPPINRASADDTLLTSYAQQRLWVLDKMGGGSAHYNMSGGLRLSGQLNIDALQRSFTSIIERHQSLRTHFIEDLTGQSIQVITQAVEFDVPLVDLSNLSSDEQAVKVTSHAKRDAGLTFDLYTDLMLRVQLLKLSDTEHVLLVNMHHIASDGWSMSILINEFKALYGAYTQGLENPLAPLAIQYADYALWQRDWLQGEVLDQHLDYWTAQLADMPVVHSIPLDKVRPVMQTYVGGAHYSEIGQTSSDSLNALCKRHKATLFMGLHAAFSALLARYSNETDIVIGSPIANREQVEVAPLIGFFVNTLVLRSDLSNNPTFSELLEQSKQVLLGGYAHQQVPFEQLVEKLQPERNTSHSPLFQVLLDLQNNEEAPLDLPDLAISPLAHEAGVAKFDLTLRVSETEQGLSLRWEYNTDLFEAHTIARMASHFAVMLDSLLEAPQQKALAANMLTERELNQQIELYNTNTKNDADIHRCIHHVFESNIQNNPQAIALVLGQQALSYQQLNERANQVAHYLIEQGVGPDVVVGLCVERSLEMVVALLGVLKAGGAYATIDPKLPQERLLYMVQDSGVTSIFTQQKLLAKLPETIQQKAVVLDGVLTQSDVFGDYPTVNPQVQVSPSHLAYITYTSGSTGQPKGAMIEHRNVIRLATGDFANFNSDTVMLHHSSISFDAMTLEVWNTLLNGGKIALYGEEKSDIAKINEHIIEHQVNTLWLSAGVFELWSNEVPNAPFLQQVMAGGDVVSPHAVQRVYKALENVVVINGYGPTENTVFTTAYSVPRDINVLSSVPLGRALTNSCVYVMNNQQALLPTGCVGELYTSGAGVGRGYLNRPEQTAEAFLTNSFASSFDSSKRLYRTGDLVRWLPQGNLEFIGRTDNQVKIRGFRIELGEVEHVLSNHPDIIDTAVLAKQSESGDKRLVAYVVTDKAGDLSATDSKNMSKRNDFIEGLQQSLKQDLPAHSIPSAFVLLVTLPLTSNGKLDRKALPKADMSLFQDDYEAPSTEVEQAVCAIYKDLLCVEKVGLNDDFFMLGGHSLLATRLITEINQHFGLTLALQIIFEIPTAKGLSDTIEDLVLIKKLSSGELAVEDLNEAELDRYLETMAEEEGSQ